MLTNILCKHILDSNIHNKYYYEVSITDSEFKETITVLAGSILASRSVAVIECYSKRNLNVAKNLFLLARLIQNKFDWYDISFQIKQNSELVPEYQNYLSDIKKFLIFS